MAPAPTIRERAGAWAALVAGGIALQAPWLQRPFGDSDINAGAYFGLFVRFFERFGFGALGGMPLAADTLVAADPFGATVPYVNHPPGVTWLAYLCGTSEAAMRSPTIVLWLISALALFELLRARFPPGWALGGAFAYLCLPSNVVLCQVSYETAVLGFGLPLLLATDRLASARGRVAGGWRVVQAVATFAGVWMDWSFGFACLALLPLARLRVRQLLVPVVAGAAALATYWLWLHATLPLYQKQPIGVDLGEMLQRNVLLRPSLGEFAHGGARALVLANSLLAPLAALPGLVLLLRRDPALAVALLVLAFLHPLTFAHHATSHFHFWGYVGPLLAASLAAYSWLHRAWLRVLGVLLLLAAIAGAVVSSIDDLGRNDTTLFKDVVEVLSRATERPAGGSYHVAHNFPSVYAYYQPAPGVVIPFLANPNWLKSAHPTRYLHLQLPPAAMRYATDSDALRTFLAQFPRERVPALEREFWLIDAAAPARIEAAWLYTITP